jgi:Zn2+/Cd2+-exporting ATPase
MSLTVLKNTLINELSIILLVIVLLIGGVVIEYNIKVDSLQYLSHLILLSAYLIAGGGVIIKAIKNLFRKNFFDENFLMTLATLGALIINALTEAVMVMLLYNIGEFLQKAAVTRSRKSIKSLLEIRPDYANLRINNLIIKTDPSEVKLNDLIIVKPGEKIPLDGKILDGSSYVNTFILTGESMPKAVAKGDDVFAGMINISGTIEIIVSRLYGESSISKIMDLVEFASHKKAKTEKFISRFAKIYSPIVVFIAVLVAFIPPLIFDGQTFYDWVYRALVILVVSCPCALVISIPLSYFGGLGSASRKGILIKGSSHLDTLVALSKIVFDKTGTLTKGVFKVNDVITRNGYSRDEILYYAYVAESYSNHPIADSIREVYGNDLQLNEIIEQQEISGLGIKVKVNNNLIVVGNDKLLHAENIHHDLCNVDGTVIHVAVNSIYAGYIIISDELKEDAEHAIKSLKSLGIREIIMLSGDNNITTTKFAEKLNIDSYFSELLPSDKLAKLDEIILETKDGKVAFVGDGINDAPVIARADLGIAMGGLGSDAAIEASDIVIMEDQPSKISEAILIARKTRKIVWQNLVFSLAVKGVFILLGAIGVATMWEAVFGDMGVALIAILNATRIFRV